MAAGQLLCHRRADPHGPTAPAKAVQPGLPRLSNGPSAGYPRVYDLALELISHVDGRIDAESLRSFITAYQEKTHLNLGELWAIPIMMRQALIENLRRVAARIAKGTLDRNKASQWADQFHRMRRADSP
jgi:cyclic beta-1,2-glucan synthetase